MSVAAAVVLECRTDEVRRWILHACNTERDHIQAYANGQLTWFRIPRENGRGVKPGNTASDCSRALVQNLLHISSYRQQALKLTHVRRIPLLSALGITFVKKGEW